LFFVQPATVLAWQRRRLRDHWARLSQSDPGRPAIATELRELVREISAANPRWGSPRILGELRKLGIAVAKSTVEKYRVRPRRPVFPKKTTGAIPPVIAAADIGPPPAWNDDVVRPRPVSGPASSSPSLSHARPQSRTAVSPATPRTGPGFRVPEVRRTGRCQARMCGRLRGMDFREDQGIAIHF
jgi:hypothetical protein